MLAISPVCYTYNYVFIFCYYVCNDCKTVSVGLSTWNIIVCVATLTVSTWNIILCVATLTVILKYKWLQEYFPCHASCDAVTCDAKAVKFLCL